MGTDTFPHEDTGIFRTQGTSERYDAVVRISEALSISSDPEEVAKILANELDQFLYFDHLFMAVLKENSKEIEHRVCGKGATPLPDLPMEELPIWEAISGPDPVRIVHWNAEERSPRFRQWVKEIGFGAGVSIPMTTAHRRLGTLGIARDTGISHRFLPVCRSKPRTVQRRRK